VAGYDGEENNPHGLGVTHRQTLPAAVAFVMVAPV
jgi:hypothetical protein